MVQLLEYFNFVYCDSLYPRLQLKAFFFIWLHYLDGPICHEFHRKCLTHNAVRSLTQPLLQKVIGFQLFEWLLLDKGIVEHFRWVVFIPEKFGLRCPMVMSIGQLAFPVCFWSDQFRLIVFQLFSIFVLFIGRLFHNNCVFFIKHVCNSVRLILFFIKLGPSLGDKFFFSLWR
jgi:hypothetical protein